MTPRDRALPWLMGWLVLLPVVVLRAGTLAESDTFWQVRTGLDILAWGRMPHVDAYSWTAAGAAWTPNSWGFDVLLGVAHRVGGLPAVAVVAAALAWVVLGMVLVLARELGAHVVPAVAGALSAGVILVGWLSARPQLVDYAAVLGLVLLARAVSVGRSPGVSAAAIVAVILVWMNLHSAAMLGVVLVAAAAGAAATAGQSRAAGLLVATAVAGGAACLVTPYGTELIRHAWTVHQQSAGVVDEWARFDPSDASQVVVLAAELTALGVALRRAERVVVAALAVLAVASLPAQRLLPLLLLVAVPTLAAGASSARVLAYLRSRRRVLVPTAVVGVALLGGVAAPALGHLGRPDPSIYPTRVAAAIPIGCDVYVPYLVGGYLILARPDVRVSIDSRNDLHGAVAVLRAERGLTGAAGVPAIVGAAGCVLVPPGSGLAALLAADPGWTRVAAEPAGVLYARA